MISDETLILDVLSSLLVRRSFASRSHFFFMKITHETISNVLTENIAPEYMVITTHSPSARRQSTHRRPLYAKLRKKLLIPKWEATSTSDEHFKF